MSETRELLERIATALESQVKDPPVSKFAEFVEWMKAQNASARRPLTYDDCLDDDCPVTLHTAATYVRGTGVGYVAHREVCGLVSLQETFTDEPTGVKRTLTTFWLEG